MSIKFTSKIGNLRAHRPYVFRHSVLSISSEVEVEDENGDKCGNCDEHHVHTEVQPYMYTTFK